MIPSPPPRKVRGHFPPVEVSHLLLGGRTVQLGMHLVVVHVSRVGSECSVPGLSWRRPVSPPHSVLWVGTDPGTPAAESKRVCRPFL